MSKKFDVLVIDPSSDDDVAWQSLLQPAAQKILRIKSPADATGPFDAAIVAEGASPADLRKTRPTLPIVSIGQPDPAADETLDHTELNPFTLIRALRYAIDRRRAAHALAKAEEKFQSLFENTVEGIFQTSATGQYLAANTALARIYGYDSPAELQSRLTNIAQDLYVETGRRDEFIKLMEEHDVVTNFESRIHRKDGAIIWISENVRAVRDPFGALLYYEGTVEDVTQKKNAEVELRNSETLYHSLVENLPQNIFRKDLNERFIFVNTRFCQTLGKKPEEIIGKTDFDFFPPELAAKYQRDDQIVVSTGKMFEAVEEHRLPNGEQLFVSVVKTPLYAATGEIIGLQCIFWDITEKRRAEEKVRQTTFALAQSREELRLKNQQLEEDLRMARDIQQAMIPSQYPTFPKSTLPEDSALKFHHLYIPTGAVGGDFFNILSLSDTKAGVFICDVMGHGVRSALVTAILRALVEELTRLAADPGQLLSQINRDLQAILHQSGSPLYTTAFYMVVDLATGCLHYANAGHPKPIHIRAATGQAEFLKNTAPKTEPALGLFPNTAYSTSTSALAPGDIIHLFTDGVYDVEHEGELLSPDWLRTHLQQHAREPIAETYDNLLAELRRLNGPKEFADDICLVSMELTRLVQ